MCNHLAVTSIHVELLFALLTPALSTNLQVVCLVHHAMLKSKESYHSKTQPERMLVTISSSISSPHYISETLNDHSTCSSH